MGELFQDDKTLSTGHEGSWNSLVKMYGLDTVEHFMGDFVVSVLIKPPVGGIWNGVSLSSGGCNHWCPGKFKVPALKVWLRLNFGYPLKVLPHNC